jgi:hypothetical protein
MTTQHLIVAWPLCFGRSAIEASWPSPKRCRHRFESRHLLLLLLPRQHLRLCECQRHQQHGYPCKLPLQVLRPLHLHRHRHQP